MVSEMKVLGAQPQQIDSFKIGGADRGQVGK